MDSEEDYAEKKNSKQVKKIYRNADDYAEDTWKEKRDFLLLQPRIIPLKLKSKQF